MMKPRKFLFLLLALFSLYALYAELPGAPNQLDANGKRTGKWIHWFDRYWKPVKREEGCVYYRELEYEDGKPKGFVSDYYRSGSLRMRTRLESVDPDVFVDTMVVVYHENGEKQAQGAFKDGKQDGAWITWHPNGIMSSEGFYVDGKLNGAWKKWYPDGKPEGQGAYANNYADGKWIMWYPDGSKRSEGVIRFERKQGIWKEWDEQGVRFEGEYTNDLRTGYWTSWDSTDAMRSEGEYKQGKMEGKWRFYYSGGETVQGSFNNNLRIGNWSARGSDGKLDWLHGYKRGIPDGRWVDYFADGSWCEGDVRKGLREGKWTWFDEQGTLSRESHFTNGQEVGERLIYDGRGVLREVHRYRMYDPFEDFYLDEEQLPVEEGFSIVCRVDGSVCSRVTYRSGSRDGVAEFYSGDGRVRMTAQYDMGTLEGSVFRQDQDGSYCLCTIENGRLNGLCESWDEETGIYTKGLYLNGEPKGLFFTTSDDGTSEYGIEYSGKRIGWWVSRCRGDDNLYAQEYKNGSHSGNLRVFDAGQRLVMKGVIRDGNREGHWQFFDSQANIVSEGEYRSGLKDGVWLEQYPGGNYAVGSYDLGNREGVWRFFGCNNSPVAEGNIEAGLRQGRWTEWTPDGSKLQGDYVNGMRSGEWILFDKTGEIHRVIDYGNPYKEDER